MITLASQFAYTFDPGNCKALRISPIPTFSYKLDEHLLEYVSNIKDLGVTVSCQLQLTSHIENYRSCQSKPGTWSC